LADVFISDTNLNRGEKRTNNGGAGGETILCVGGVEGGGARGWVGGRVGVGGWVDRYNGRDRDR